MANEDKAKGHVKETTGTAKEKAGKVTGNERLEGEGKAERGEGFLDRMKGKIKDKL